MRVRYDREGCGYVMTTLSRCPDVLSRRTRHSLSSMIRDRNRAARSPAKKSPKAVSLRRPISMAMMSRRSVRRARTDGAADIPKASKGAEQGHGVRNNPSDNSDGCRAAERK